MSNKSRRLYTGITSRLVAKTLPGFTAHYKFDMLVYYEEYSNVISAIAREKEIKGWRRDKKLELILDDNPDWADLSAEWDTILPGRRSRVKNCDGFSKEDRWILKSSRAGSSPAQLISQR